MGPAIELLAVRLLPFLVGVFMLMWSKSARGVLVSLLHGVAAVPSFLVGVIKHGGVIEIDKAAKRAVHASQSQQTRHTQAGVGQVAKYFQGVAHRTRAVNAAHVKFADTTAWGLHRMRTHVIPREIRLETRPMRRELAVHAHAIALDQRRWRAEQKARARGIDRLKKEFLIPLALAFAGIDAYVKRPHAHAHHRDHVTTLPRTVARGRANSRDIARLKKATTVAAISAIVALVMTRVLPSWRCSNFKNFARKLRCQHWKWLDDLLFGALALIAVVDPVALARQAVRVEDTLDAIIREIAD